MKRALAHYTKIRQNAVVWKAGLVEGSRVEEDFFSYLESGFKNQSMQDQTFQTFQV